MGLDAPGEFDAPEGLLILDAPSANAKVLRFVPGPISLGLTHYVENDSQRFYLTAEGLKMKNNNQVPYWVSILGTNRAEFIAGTTPARLLKQEKRDFDKEGMVTADIYEETVNLALVTDWGRGYRRAEVDFGLPGKINAFSSTREGIWELDITVFPATDHYSDRIPAAHSEGYSNYPVLISRPMQKELKIRVSRFSVNVPNWALS